MTTREAEERDRKVRDLLFRVTMAQDRLTMAELNAAGCCTPYDWDRVHQERTEYGRVYEEVVSELIQMIVGGGE